jgi:myosin heavy subunit
MYVLALFWYLLVTSADEIHVRRLSPNQIQKLLNQYLVADYEQPINGEIMKAVASRVTEKSDVLLLQAVDMDDSGPYEIAEPRVITALETYTPSCKLNEAFCCQLELTNICQGYKRLG